MKVIKNNNVFQEIIDGDLFLYNQDTQKIVSLNKVASVIWEMIDGKEEKELFEEFMEMFNFVDEDERKLAESDFETVFLALKDAACIIQK